MKRVNFPIWAFLINEHTSWMRTFLKKEGAELCFFKTWFLANLTPLWTCSRYTFPRFLKRRYSFLHGFLQGICYNVWASLRWRARQQPAQFTWKTNTIRLLGFLQVRDQSLHPMPACFIKIWVSTRNTSFQNKNTKFARGIQRANF